MIALLLVSFSTLLGEASLSIGKDQVKHHKESVFAMGFLDLAFGAVLFAIIAIARGEFQFSVASLPTFIPRLCLEIMQAHLTVKAIAVADRSTFSFLRLVTIPLLLVADTFFGYGIGVMQVAGIVLLLCTLVFLVVRHGIRTRGMGLVLFTSMNAVITISLYQYNIRHFNSVEAEQGIVFVVLLVYFAAMAWITARQNVLRFFTQRIAIGQSVSQGVSYVIESFAYQFAPASVVITIKRAFSVMWAIISGSMHFKETHVGVKLAAFVLMLGGLVAMGFGMVR